MEASKVNGQSVQGQAARLDRMGGTVLTLLCAAWGLNQVAIKVANVGVSPLYQCGLRSIGAVLLLMLWARWRGIPLWNRDGSLPAGLAVGALFAVEFLLIYQGLTYTSASRGVLFLYTAPFVVALGTHWWVPDDKLSAAKVTGLSVAFAGLLIAFAEGLRLPNRQELIGDALCLAGAVAWGATTVTIKATRLARIRAEKTLFYQLAVSAVALPVVAALVGERGVFAPTPLVWAAMAYQVVIVAFASYAAWFWLMTCYPASRLAAFSFLTPVFGVLFGGWLLNEPVTLGLAAALVLIAAGIYLVNKPARGA